MRSPAGCCDSRKAEAVGKHLDEVFRIVNEFSRSSVESPVSKVLREGRIVGMANHTVLLANDGTEVPIDDSGAPIRNERGRTARGTVLVFRDVTPRRRADETSRLLAVAIVESTDDAIFSTGSSKAWSPSWNKGAERIFGYTAAEMIGLPVSGLGARSTIRAKLPACWSASNRANGFEHQAPPFGGLGMAI